MSSDVFWMGAWSAAVGTFIGGIALAVLGTLFLEAARFISERSDHTETSLRWVRDLPLGLGLLWAGIYSATRVPIDWNWKTVLLGWRGR